MEISESERDHDEAPGDRSDVLFHAHQEDLLCGLAKGFPDRFTAGCPAAAPAARDGWERPGSNARHYHGSIGARYGPGGCSTFLSGDGRALARLEARPSRGHEDLFKLGRRTEGVRLPINSRAPQFRLKLTAECRTQRILEALAITATD